MNTQHTPGPWKAVIDAGKVVGIFSTIQNPEEDWHGPHGQTIVETDCGYYPPGLADALLIAAAPDLLEVLQWIRPFIRKSEEGSDMVTQHVDWVQFRKWIDCVDAAIAKATNA